MRSGRLRPRDRRRVPSPLLVLVLVCAVVAGARLGRGASATFVSQTSATTGTLGFARLTASFATGTDDLGGAGGTGGSSYVITISALATPVHRFTTLTNTGSVTASIAGTVSASGLSGTMNVAVDACSVAWSLGLCSGTQTSLRSATAITGAPAVSYGSLAVNGVTYLRYTFSATSVLPSATVTATAVPTGTGTGNRTAG